MAKCKITVLKKMINRDLIDEYCSLDLSDQCLGCHLLTVGEEFIVEDHNTIPEGFCSRAWEKNKKGFYANGENINFYGKTIQEVKSKIDVETKNDVKYTYHNY